MVEYDAKKEWTKTIVKQQDIAYPPEYIIRIFKGTYPNLDLDKKNFPGKKLCDVGFGDGRNFPLLQKCGFELSGVEITDDIVAVTKKHMAALGIEANLKTGKNDSIPFPDNYFDYLISWNACYYMGDNRDFNKYVSEFSRVMKKGATLVLSIPKKSCFIYKDSETLKPGYQIIRNDPFNVRNGEVLRMFQDELEIEKVFSKHFTEFVHGSIHDDCFGYAYHWHLVVCKKI